MQHKRPPGLARVPQRIVPVAFPQFTAPEIARAIVDFLQPVMQKLSQLLTALPPP